MIYNLARAFLWRIWLGGGWAAQQCVCMCVCVRARA